MSHDREAAGQPGSPAYPVFLPPPSSPGTQAPAVPLGYPPFGYGICPPAAPEPRRGWTLPTLVLGSGVVLVLAGFLPWLRVTWVLGGALVDFSGVRADGTGSVVALCGCTAVSLVPVGAVLRRAMVTLATLPGGVAFLACLIFALRQRQLGRDSEAIHISFGLQYGWYVALAASMVLLGVGLSEAVLSRRSRDDAAAWDRAASPSPR